jgi:hypothetical protein
MPDYKSFDPEGDGYDYVFAIESGLAPSASNGHWGSVAPAPALDKVRFHLPVESYVLLKGRKHETWDKAVKGEADRGFKVVKLGDRYYSVPDFYEEEQE